MPRIRFYTDFDFEYGVLETVSPLVRRIVARNPGSFTGPGTGTYVLGHGRVALIDPGPALSSHVEAVLHALRNETVDQIIITHTHPDHWPAASSIQRATGAKTYGLGRGGSGYFDHGVQDGDLLEGDGWRLQVIHTPGHTSDHLSYGMEQEKILFSGDHVMGWSTSVIIPPDGDMGDYMRSLQKVLARDETVYLPTHGPAITDPKTHVKAFIDHRNERSEAILTCLDDGIGEVDDIVRRVYAGVHPGLYGAAGLSVQAHLIELVRTGQAKCDGPAEMAHRYRAGRG
jgi:glyoxylase-like metal-dependent hydrolase (beta-lactamase superfamily II)